MATLTRLAPRARAEAAALRLAAARRPRRHQRNLIQTHAGARAAVLLARAAGDLRAAVRLRLRRRDPDPGRRRRRRLPRVPHAGHLRPDRGLRRRVDDRRPGRGHAQGHHRPVPRRCRCRRPPCCFGRTFADAARQILVLVVLSHHRARRRLADPQRRSLNALWAYALLLLFAYTVAWIGVVGRPATCRTPRRPTPPG